MSPVILQFAGTNNSPHSSSLLN